MVIAVEPERENFELLARNTADSPNIVAVNSAIWSDSRPRQLKDRSTGSWGYTIAESENPTILMDQFTPCVTIESLMRDHGLDRIDILKMDVEGSEKSILEASEPWIDSVAVLTIELHDRIAMGCSRAFYLATKDYERFEASGEKVTAFRH
jgi:FkbM family methyltransferase